MLRDGRGYFGMLAVHPSRQRTGLGRLLVQAAAERLRHRGAQYMDIALLSLRPALLPWYQNLGYVDTGIAAFHPSRALKEGVECHSITLSKRLV